ncbi:hypothetical protein [Paracoccus yeei]|uniref:hypothetical protein n=1 Tax=Paracoccus yeei TaxID=147645 RepID=UPI00117D844F|nr:hypothetical protein [Paracoccus yeei]
MNTLSTIKLSRAVNERGNIVTATVPDGRMGSLFVAKEIADDPKLGPAFKMMESTVTESSETLVARNEDGYHGKALETERDTFRAKVTPAFHHAIKVTQDARSNYHVRVVRTTEFNRNAEPNAYLRHDLRQHLMKHDAATRMKILLDSNYDMAVAALEIGNDVIGVDQRVWDDFLDHARALIHIRNAGIDASSVRKSTPEFISAAGTDPDAAMAQAKDAVKRLHEDGEVLDLAESCLKHVAAFISLLADKSVEEILPK